MRRLAITEHARVVRRAGDEEGALEPRLYDRLRRLDCHGRPGRDRVFDWRDGHARAQQWVGVIQVPGLQVEILPKIDAPGTSEFSAQANLLYMLAVGGDVPLRAREVARLTAREAPLSDALAAIFAERLLRELMRGPESAYIQHEENLRRFKGKLLVSEQARRNPAHRERFYCRYEEFSDDTRMNRIFKAACLTLVAITRSPSTQEALRQCLLLLDGVRTGPVQPEDFDAVVINRQNQRFEDVLQFCRLILSGRSPTAEAGRTSSFSILFDMNKVFERFVAALVRHEVAPRLGATVYTQAAGRRRHLMSSRGAGVLRLEPDLLIELAGRRMVIDTKWKLLVPGGRARGGVADGDLYQLYAYARRYGSRHSVLLYPHLPAVEPRDFDVLEGDQGTPSGERVAIRQVNLHRDLRKPAERALLVAELETIVRQGLEAPEEAA